MKITGTSNLAEAFYSLEAQAERAKDRVDTARTVNEKVFQTKRPTQDFRRNQMRNLRIKSNSARDKTLVLGPNNELVLCFNRDGVALMPDNLLPILKRVMQLRPGRFRVLKDEVKAKKPVVSAAKLDVKEFLAKLKDEEEEESEEILFDLDDDADDEPPTETGDE